jgi:hypothetical protein
MTGARRFSDADLDAIRLARSLGVRSGAEHRYTRIWVVVVEGRVLVRSWNDEPTGWYRAFLEEPRGSISFGRKEVAAVGRRVRSARLRHAASLAFAAKYDTKGAEKWVRGFAEPAREATTLEFVPA